MKEQIKKKINTKQIVISDNYVGQRIDNFLIRYFGGIPNSRIYQMLRKGEVRVNSGRIKQTYRLALDDVVRIPPVYIDDKFKPKPAKSLQKKLQNSILYEDELSIIINKPAGIVVHSGSGQLNGVIEALRATGIYPKIELVHRLDKDTSGCLILAKDIPALRLLQKTLNDISSKKRYLALLSGKLNQNQLIVDSPLQKNTISSGERIVKVDVNGKTAKTVFFRKDLFDNATLAEVEIYTGRTHQIRVHGASVGHFVLGDRKYGDKLLNRQFKERGLNRMFLHAQSVSFISPLSKEKITVNSPLDDELKDFLKQMKK